MSLLKRPEKPDMTEEEREEQRLQFRTMEIFMRVMLEAAAILYLIGKIANLW